MAAAPNAAAPGAARRLVDEVVGATADATDEWLLVKARVRAHIKRVMAGDTSTFRQVMERQLRECARERKTLLILEHTLSSAAWKDLDPKGVLSGQVPGDVMPTRRQVWEDVPEYMRPFLSSMYALETSTSSTVREGKTLEMGKIKFQFTWNDQLRAELARRAEEFRAGAKRKAEGEGDAEREVRVKSEPA